MVKGYELLDRTKWPDYRRSALTLACAFDRSDLVRALVVDFEGSMASNLEYGIVLVSEDGQERVWEMSGFDVAIEFGCLKTLKLLCDLEQAHPYVTKTIEYANIAREDCFELCGQMGNKLDSAYASRVVLSSLRGWTDKICECRFCSRPQI